MAISTLIVAIRTAGAAALTRLGAGFTALGARARAAAAAMHAAASPRIAAGLTRIAAAARFAATQFSRLARAAASAARNMAVSAFSTMLPVFAKWGAILLGVTALLVPLVPIVTHLAGAALLLAPALFSLVTAGAALKIAFSGIGDVIKLGLDATSADDIKEYHKALDKLTPAAREFAHSAVEIVKAWRPVKKAVQEAFFGGGIGGNNLAHEIRQISIEFRPLVMKWLPQVSRAFGELFKSASDFLTLPSTKADFEGIFRNTQRAIEAMLGTIKALGRAFLDITAVAAPRFANLTESIEDAANRFAAWIKKMRESGKITEWIDNAKETLGQLGDIAKQVGRVFTGIFKAGDDQQKPFLEGVRDSLKALADWAHSEDGQAFLKGLGQIAAAVANVIVWITKAGEKFSELIDWLRSLRGAGDEVTNGLGRIAAAGAAAFGWVGGAIASIGRLVANVQGGMRSIQSAINSVVGRVVFLDVITRRSEQGFARALGNSGGTGGSKMSVRAAGGPVTAGTPYIVGEKRAEVFVPNRSGRILPSVPGGGGAVQVVLEPRPGIDRILGDAIIRMLSARVRGVDGGINALLAGVG